MPRPLSSNAFSVDDQTADAISYLSREYPALSDEFVREFPEYNSLEWYGSWVDCEASNVDPDYMSWVVEWLESHTPIRWEDGEPFDMDIDYE